MSTVKLWKAINQALHDAMASDGRVVLLGQDVGTPGGPYGLSRGLKDTFGAERVRDAPISEAALVASGIGAAMVGLRPVVEVMFFDFITLALDQLVNQAAKYRFFTHDRGDLPLVIHTLYGGRASMGAQHSQSLEALLCHIPGLKVVFPSTPQDAYGALRAALDDPDPVVVITPIASLRNRGPLDTARARSCAPGTGRRVQSGDQVTLLTWGPATEVCEQAIEGLDARVDLIDLRWLQPWPEKLVRESLRRTSRLLVVHDAVEAGGWGAELVARLVQDEFWYLDAPPMRIGAPSTPLPVAERNWTKVLPRPADVRAAIAELLGSTPHSPASGQAF